MKFFEFFWIFFWKFFAYFVRIFWKIFWKSVPPPKKNPGYTHGITESVFPKVLQLNFQISPKIGLEYETSKFRTKILYSSKRFIFPFPVLHFFQAPGPSSRMVSYTEPKMAIIIRKFFWVSHLQYDLLKLEYFLSRIFIRVFFCLSFYLSKSGYSRFFADFYSCFAHFVLNFRIYVRHRQILSPYC